MHCELNITGPSPSDGGVEAAGATGGTEPDRTEPGTGTNRNVLCFMLFFRRRRTEPNKQSCNKQAGSCRIW